MCKLCHDSGLIPFVRYGKVIANAWLDCKCKESPRDHYRAVTPSDFDFACSDSWRGYYHEEFGGRDPTNTGSYRELPDITAVEDRITDLELEQDLGKNWQTSKVWRHQVEQLKSQVLFLQSKLNEHTKPKERLKKPTGYKGIK